MTPEQIEQQSFAIIDQEAGDHGLEPDSWQVVRRVIHTTADFQWLEMMRFSPGAIDAGIQALAAGRRIVTDTRMMAMGIAGKAAGLHCPVVCRMAEAATARLAEQHAATRAQAAVDLEVQAAPSGGIWAVGNAPTALLRIIEHVAAGRLTPDLVIGLPVGFVNAAESKQALMALDIPWISNVGRKGGSAVAAAVINALCRMAAERKVNR